MLLQRICFFLVLIINCTYSHAQQFSTQGSATQSGSFTYTITPDALSQAGMITNYYPVDLTKSFSIKFQLYFGTKDDVGADGFAFLLNNSCSPLLTVGSGLGVSGISNSIIVEFDTWTNGDAWNDMTNDHTGIYADGQLNAAGNITDGLTTPVCLLSNCNNVEDGQWHDVTIDWEYFSSTSQRITVTFDNIKRITSTRSHLSERFGNNPVVFWSVSASTGGNSNLQQLRVEPGSNNVINACIGKPFTLTAPTPGTNYSWSRGTSATNTSSFNVIGNETITCSYTDYCNVQRSVSFSVIANQNPSVTVNSFTTCEASPDAVTATPAAPATYTYNWTVPTGATNPGNVQSFLPALAGTYAVTITNTATGCGSISAAGNIVFTPALKPDFLQIDTVCKGSIIVLPTTSLNGVSGTWSPAFNNQATTVYTFTSDGTVCAFPATMRIVINSPPIPRFDVNRSICLGETRLLHPIVTGYGFNYTWQDGSKDSVFTTTQPGIYTVNITNSCGISNSRIELIGAVCKIFIPNAFTPNGDGLNDLFQISGALYVKDFSLQVYNRWGQIQYATSNAFKGWDGTFNGLPANPGIYTYRISYTDVQNKKRVQTGGNLVLLK
jgi:gliding motility-associated-like protein